MLQLSYIFLTFVLHVFPVQFYVEIGSPVIFTAELRTSAYGFLGGAAVGLAEPGSGAGLLGLGPVPVAKIVRNM